MHRWQLYVVALSCVASNMVVAAPAFADTLVNGGSVNGVIAVAGQQDSYTYTANAGEGIQLQVADVGSGSYTPVLTVYAPSGAVVTSVAGADVAAAEFQTPATGVYTVVIGDESSGRASTGNYALYFTHSPGANEGGALFDGVARSDTIDLGDLDSYTFSATAGQTPVITVTDTSGGPLTPVVTLYGPTGATLASTAGAVTASIGGHLSTTGVYTLVVGDQSSGHASVGPYSIVVTGSGGTPVPVPAWSVLVLTGALGALGSRRANRSSVARRR
jgi:hypothetical protein